MAHVGDSRGYRLRGTQLEQFTFDHSLVWEMRAASRVAGATLPDFIPKNVITRSLGPNPAVQVDLEGPLPIAPGDTFLLCSDGLSGPVNDEEIGMILGCLPPAEACGATGRSGQSAGRAGQHYGDRGAGDGERLARGPRSRPRRLRRTARPPGRLGRGRRHGPGWCGSVGLGHVLAAAAAF